MFRVFEKSNRSRSIHGGVENQHALCFHSGRSIATVLIKKQPVVGKRDDHNVKIADYWFGYSFSLDPKGVTSQEDF